MRHVPGDKFGAFSPSCPILAKVKSGMSGGGKRSQGGYEWGMEKEAVGWVLEDAWDIMLHACML